MKTVKKSVRLVPVIACAAWTLACSSSSSPATMKDSGLADTGIPKGDGGKKKTDAGMTKPDGGMTKPDGGMAKKDSGEPRDTGVTRDSGVDAHKTAVDASDAGPARHVLVTYDSTSSKTDPCTMFAVNLDTGAIDGQLSTTDTQAITDTSNAFAPFLLDQGEDKVVQINPTGWTASSTWSVALPGDAGGNYSDPYAVSVTADDHAFVIRYDTNLIDVLDVSSQGTGQPMSSIDLTSLAEPTGDGVVHAAAEVYVAASHLLYVALQNINLDTEGSYDGTYYTLCAGTSTVIAIDTMTHAVHSLGGTALGGGVTLQGYDPQIMTYDEAGGRLLLFNAGCSPSPTADGGAPGAAQQAGVEAVDLATNTSTVLLDTSTVTGFPASFAYVKPDVAVLGFQYPSAAYAWDPTKTTLGALLPNAPDLFDYDGNGNLVGAVIVPSSQDGGASTTSIVSMSLTTKVATTLQSNVISLGGTGYIASVGVWPRP